MSHAATIELGTGFDERAHIQARGETARIVRAVWPYMRLREIEWKDKQSADFATGQKAPLFLIAQGKDVGDATSRDLAGMAAHWALALEHMAIWHRTEREDQLMCERAVAMRVTAIALRAFTKQRPAAKAYQHIINLLNRSALAHIARPAKP